MSDDLYRRLKAQYPDLTPEQFKAALTQLSGSKAAAAGDFTPAAGDTTDPQRLAVENDERAESERRLRERLVPGFRLIDKVGKVVSKGENASARGFAGVMRRTAPDVIAGAERRAADQRQPLYYSHIIDEGMSHLDIPESVQPPMLTGAGTLMPRIPVRRPLTALTGAAVGTALDPTTYLTSGLKPAAGAIAKGGKLARMIADAEHAVVPEIRFAGKNVLPRQAQLAAGVAAEKVDRTVRPWLTAGPALGSLFNKSFRPAGVVPETWKGLQQERQAGRVTSDERAKALMNELDSIFEGLSKQEEHDLRGAVEAMQTLPTTRLEDRRKRYMDFMDKMFDAEEVYGLQEKGAKRPGYVPHIQERGMRRFLAETEMLTKQAAEGDPTTVAKIVRGARREAMEGAKSTDPRYRQLLSASRTARHFMFGKARKLAGTLDELAQAGWTNYILDTKKAAKIRAVGHARAITAQDFVVDALQRADVAKPIGHASEVVDNLERGLNYYAPRIVEPGNIQKAGRGIEALGNLSAVGAREALSQGKTVYLLDDDVAKAINAMGEIERTGPHQLLQMYDDFTTLWKVHTLNLFPAYYWRNVVGDLSRNWMVGMKDPAYYARAKHGLIGNALPSKVMGLDPSAARAALEPIGLMPRSVGELATGRATLDEVLARESRSVRARRAEIEAALASSQKPLTLVDLKAEAEHHGALAGFTKSEIGLDDASWKPLSKDFRPIRWMSKIGDAMDQNTRLAHYLWRREAGDTAEQATKSVRKVLFDYGDMAPADKWIKRFLPFWSWTRYNIPFQLQLAMMKPGDFTQMARAQRMVEGRAGAPPNEEHVPEWMETALPVRVGKEGTSYFLLGSWVPAADLLRLKDKSMLTDMIHPTILSVLEVIDNEDRRLSGEYQEKALHRPGLPLGEQVKTDALHVLRRHSRAFAEGERAVRDVKELGLKGGAKKSALRFGTGARLFPVDQNWERQKREWQVEDQMGLVGRDLKSEARRKQRIEDARREREARP